MKSFFISIFVLTFSLSSHGQGTLYFANYGSVGINAPVYLSDRVTPLAGLQFQAELLAGPSPTSMVPLAATAFWRGAAAGYYYYSVTGGIVVVPNVAPGQYAWVQVEVWNTASGASFDQALASGLPDSWWASSVFSVRTGNEQLGGRPTPPAPLTGLGTAPGYLNTIPEPSTYALASLGGAVALFRAFRHPKPNRSRQPAPVASQANGPTVSVRCGCAQR